MSRGIDLDSLKHAPEYFEDSGFWLEAFPPQGSAGGQDATSPDVVVRVECLPPQAFLNELAGHLRDRPRIKNQRAKVNLIFWSPGGQDATSPDDAARVDGADVVAIRRARVLQVVEPGTAPENLSPTI